MADYAKTKVNNIVSVDSIATVLRVDLRHEIAGNDVHDFPEIFYMAEGRGSTIVNGQILSLEAGQMVIYGSNSPHRNGTGGIAEIISFETTQPLPELLFNRVITLSGEQRVMLGGIIAKAVPLFEHRIGIRGMTLKRDADPYAVQIVKNMLELFLLDLLSPAKSYAKDRMIIITDYMIKNMSRVLTLQDISSELGISIATLKRLVDKAYSTSPIAYFMGLKMEEAKRLIADTPLNVTEVSEQLGFSSVHHFSRAFKQKTGITPTEYEKNARP